jgi:hypothetical protein
VTRSLAKSCVLKLLEVEDGFVRRLRLNRVSSDGTLHAFEATSQTTIIADLMLLWRLEFLCPSAFRGWTVRYSWGSLRRSCFSDGWVRASPRISPGADPPFVGATSCKNLQLF